MKKVISTGLKSVLSTVHESSAYNPSLTEITWSNCFLCNFISLSQHCGSTLIYSVASVHWALWAFIYAVLLRSEHKQLQFVDLLACLGSLRDLVGPTFSWCCGCFDGLGVNLALLGRSWHCVMIHLNAPDQQTAKMSTFKEAITLADDCTGSCQNSL